MPAWAADRFPPVRLNLGLLLAASLALVALATVASTRADLYRFVFAALLVANLVLLALSWPRAAILATMLFLPFLALMRRLLIESSGWTSTDPLLLVGPLVAAALLSRAFVFERRSLAPDFLSKLLLVYLGLAVLGIFNPFGGGLLTGASGLLFVGAPLLWFFVGRYFADRGLAIALLYATIALACGIAIYGLLQVESGFPPWDAAWIDIAGYGSLSVGGVIRSFGTFSSASEYATYLSVAVAFGAAIFLRGRRWWALPILSLLAAALFLSSVRGQVIFVFLAILIMASLRIRARMIAMTVIALGIVVAVVAVQLQGSTLTRAATEGGNRLIVHQVEGLTRPFDPEVSTVGVHLSSVTRGIADGFTHPLGQGTGVTSLASKEFTSTTQNTEFDFSNAVVSLGLAGGVVFLLIVFTAFRQAIARYRNSFDPAVLAALGLMVVTLGGWLNGAHYALAPLIWLMIGWVTGSAGQSGPNHGNRLDSTHNSEANEE